MSGPGTELEGERPREPGESQACAASLSFTITTSAHAARGTSRRPTILFVTFAIQPRTPQLANEAFQEAFTDACHEADAWSVGFYMIMPDHVHVFCQPARVPRVGIHRWVSYLKRRITLNHGPHVWTWQPDRWDTQMRSGEHYHERWEYVSRNPVRKGLVAEPKAWPWQGVLHELRW